MAGLQRPAAAVEREQAPAVAGSQASGARQPFFHRVINQHHDQVIVRGKPGDESPGFIVDAAAVANQANQAVMRSQRQQLPQRRVNHALLRRSRPVGA